MPTLSDYLKVVARRSLAGFAAVHNELLQRYRGLSGAVMNRSQTVSTCSPNTGLAASRQTFVSYVVEDMYDCRGRETVIIPHPGTVVVKSNTFPLTRMDDKHVPHEMIINNETLIETKLDEDMVNNELEEAVKQVNNVKQYSENQNKNDYANSETISKNSPSANSVVVNEEGRRDTGAPYYVNMTLAELTESDHIYDIPKLPNSVESSVSAITEAQNTHMAGDTHLQVHGTSSYQFESEPESDYIDASSTSYTANDDKHETKNEVNAQSSNKPLYIEPKQSLTNPHSAFIQSLMVDSESGENNRLPNDDDHTYINILPGHNEEHSTDADNEYVLPEHIEQPPSDGDNEYILPEHIEQASIDAENEYILPGTDGTLEIRNPRPASVAHVMPQAAQQTTPVRPRARPFLMYTVEEVVDCFEECALPQLAHISKEENLDGEYFKDLSDRDFAQEPFLLNRFYVSKVRKIIAGWRPKRLSMHH